MHAIVNSSSSKVTLKPFTLPCRRLPVWQSLYEHKGNGKQA